MLSVMLGTVAPVHAAKAKSKAKYKFEIDERRIDQSEKVGVPRSTL